MIRPLCNAIHTGAPCEAAAVYESEVTCPSEHDRGVTDCAEHWEMLQARRLNCRICKVASGGQLVQKLQVLSTRRLSA